MSKITARRILLENQYISNVEIGNRARVSAGVVAKIRKELGFPSASELRNISPEDRRAEIMYYGKLGLQAVKSAMDQQEPIFSLGGLCDAIGINQSFFLSKVEPWMWRECPNVYPGRTFQYSERDGYSISDCVPSTTARKKIGRVKAAITHFRRTGTTYYHAAQATPIAKAYGKQMLAQADMWEADLEGRVRRGEFGDTVVWEDISDSIEV